MDKLFPTDDSTITAVPDSLVATEVFNSTTDVDTDRTMCYSSDSKGMITAHRGGGGSPHSGGVGTEVMITVHSSPARIARITDAFKDMKKKHCLSDAKLQLLTYVSMKDDYIVVPKDEPNTSEETYELNSTETMLCTTTEMSSDASKSDTTASEIKVIPEMQLDSSTTGGDPHLTQNETPDPDESTDEHPKSPKKGNSDGEGKLTDKTPKSAKKGDSDKKDAKPKSDTNGDGKPKK